MSANDLLIELKILDPRLHQWGLPEYATSGAAAVDLRAAIDKPIQLYPGEQHLISTGLAVHVANPHYAAVALPRSGLGTKGLVLGNTVGLVDSDYQGPVMLQVWNRLRRDEGTVGIRESLIMTIQPGDRIAQLVILPVARATFKPVDEFSQSSARGEGGFGHTGKV